MGKRGPAPKPTALKVIEGNPGKQRIEDTGEPMPPVPEMIPKPPKRLMREAKREWNRLAPVLVRLGVLTEVDLSAFAELCQNYAYYREADKEIMTQGEKGALLMQQTPSGYIQQHPIISLRRQYYETWRKGLADFGLTPSSRARIVTGNGGSAEPKSEMERLLSGDY